MTTIKKIETSKLNLLNTTNLINKNTNTELENIKKINPQTIDFHTNQSGQTKTESLISKHEPTVLKNKKGTQTKIYNSFSLYGRNFGGDQGNLNQLSINNYTNPKIKEIVSKYYSDVTDEDLQLLFYRMASVGCGYIAAVNTLMIEYGFYYFDYAFDNFKGKFDFSIYKPLDGYSYDYLFLDFFLYYAKEFKGYKTIEEVYGNAEEERSQTEGGDSALSSDSFKKTGMDRTIIKDVGVTFKNYLSDNGIDIKFNKKEDYPLMTPVKDIIDITTNDINQVMVVGAKDFTLYYPFDKDGNGKLDDIYNQDIGAHAMTVVGFTDDPNKVAVSSWGEEYIMDISDIDNYGVYDYSSLNLKNAMPYNNLENQSLTDNS